MLFHDAQGTHDEASQRFALAAGCHENQLTKWTKIFERKKALKRNVATRQPARDVRQRCSNTAKLYRATNLNLSHG